MAKAVSAAAMELRSRMQSAGPSFRFKAADVDEIAQCLQVAADKDCLDDGSASFCLDDVTQLSLNGNTIMLLRSGLVSASLTRTYGMLLAPKHRKALFLCGASSDRDSESGAHLEIHINSGECMASYRLISPSPNFLARWYRFNQPGQQLLLGAPAPAEASAPTLLDRAACDWVTLTEQALDQNPEMTLEEGRSLVEGPLVRMLSSKDNPMGERLDGFISQQLKQMSALGSDDLDSAVELTMGFMSGIHQLLLLEFPVLDSSDVLETATHFAIQSAVLEPVHNALFGLFLECNAHQDAQWHIACLRLAGATPEALHVPKKHLGWVGHGELWQVTIGINIK